MFRFNVVRLCTTSLNILPQDLIIYSTCSSFVGLACVGYLMARYALIDASIFSVSQYTLRLYVFMETKTNLQTRMLASHAALLSLQFRTPLLLLAVSCVLTSAAILHVILPSGYVFMAISVALVVVIMCAHDVVWMVKSFVEMVSATVRQIYERLTRGPEEDAYP